MRINILTKVIMERSTKRVSFLLCSILMIFILIGCGFASSLSKSAASQSSIVVFRDRNLEAVVRNTLKKPAGPIMIEDVRKITELKANSKVERQIDSFVTDKSHNISNIEGLQYFYSLEKLNLQGNFISDISPIKRLIKLKELDISCNSVRSINALSGLKNLERLDISWNGIKDIRPLEKLTNLKELSIGTGAESSPMEYEKNKIKDISALKGMIDLSFLDIKEIGVNDISALKNMKQLKKLLISQNEMSSIQALENMKELLYLDLGYNHVLDVSPLQVPTKLEYLYANNNNISQIKALKGLKALKEVNISGNKITDISVLADISGLRRLDLRGNRIREIGALKFLNDIEYLNLANNQVTNIEALGRLTNLSTLLLSGNKIENISVLKKLTHIRQLNIDGNRIKDFSPLEDSKNIVVSGVTAPIYKEPKDRSNVPQGLKWDPYKGMYYYPNEFELNSNKNEEMKVQLFLPKLKDIYNSVYEHWNELKLDTIPIMEKPLLDSGDIEYINNDDIKLRKSLVIVNGQGLDSNLIFEDKRERVLTFSYNNKEYSISSKSPELFYNYNIHGVAVVIKDNNIFLVKQRDYKKSEPNNSLSLNRQYKKGPIGIPYIMVVNGKRTELGILQVGEGEFRVPEPIDSWCYMGLPDNLSKMIPEGGMLKRK